MNRFIVNEIVFFIKDVFVFLYKWSFIERDFKF